MFVPLSYNLRSIWVRKSTTLLTVFGIVEQSPGATHGVVHLDVVGVKVDTGRVVSEDHVGAGIADDAHQAAGHVVQVSLVQAIGMLVVG